MEDKRDRQKRSGYERLLCWKITSWLIDFVGERIPYNSITLNNTSLSEDVKERSFTIMNGI